MLRIDFHRSIESAIETENYYASQVERRLRMLSESIIPPDTVERMICIDGSHVKISINDVGRVPAQSLDENNVSSAARGLLLGNELRPGEAQSTWRERID